MTWIWLCLLTFNKFACVTLCLRCDLWPGPSRPSPSPSCGNPQISAAGSVLPHPGSRWNFGFCCQEPAGRSSSLTLPLRSAQIENYTFKHLKTETNSKTLWQQEDDIRSCETSSGWIIWWSEMFEDGEKTREVERGFIFRPETREREDLIQEVDRAWKSVSWRRHFFFWSRRTSGKRGREKKERKLEKWLLCFCSLVQDYSVLRIIEQKSPWCFLFISLMKEIKPICFFSSFHLKSFQWNLLPSSATCSSTNIKSTVYPESGFVLMFPSLINELKHSNASCVTCFPPLLFFFDLRRVTLDPDANAAISHDLHKQRQQLI